METENLIKLPSSSNSEHGSENGDACESGSEAINSESLPSNSKVIEEIRREAPGAIAGVLDENMDALMEDNFEKGPNCISATPPIGFEMTNSVADVGKAVPVSSVHAENGFLSIQSETNFSNLQKNETLSNKREVGANSLSGVKRPRMVVDEQQPSVHAIYSSLPSADGFYSDGKSARITAEVLARAQELSQSLPGMEKPREIDINTVFLESPGILKKNYVFGLGSPSRSMSTASVTSAAPPQYDTQAAISELQARMAAQEELLQTQHEQIRQQQEIIQQLTALIERQQQKMN